MELNFPKMNPLHALFITQVSNAENCYMLLSYLRTYLLAYLLIYLHTYLLTFLPTYLLAYLLA